MAQMIGRTGSWLYWMAGLLCAWVFGPRADAAEIARPSKNLPPDASQPAVNEEQQKRAEKLVADYLTPAFATEPAADQKAAIEKLIKDFGSSEFKTRDEASAAVVKQGPAALGQLREAAKSKDAEVASRSSAAVIAIEQAARTGIVDELKKMLAVAQSVANKQLAETRAAQTTAQQAAGAAAAKSEEGAKLRKEAEDLGARSAALMALLRQLSPLRDGGGKMAPVYGIRMQVD